MDMNLKMNKRYSEASIKALQKAILNLHGCKATWVKSIPVKELFKGETVWEGVVEVFDLENHSTANRAYAWSHRIGHSRKRKFFAVLHQGPIKSAQDAVRAAIVKAIRVKNTG